MFVAGAPNILAGLLARFASKSGISLIDVPEVIFHSFLDFAGSRAVAAVAFSCRSVYAHCVPRIPADSLVLKQLWLGYSSVWAGGIAELIFGLVSTV